jgi:membrane protease YdiL (CAAX protease family)
MAPPGWYLYPGSSVYYWWDGRAWTDITWPPPPTEASGSVAAPVHAEPSRRVSSEGEATRKSLVWETRFVMVAFLVPAVMSAVVLLAQHVGGVGTVTRFPTIIKGHPLGNMLIGIFAYLPVAATVPLALFLLARTGQSPRVLGLGLPSFKRDILPGLGLAAASFGAEIVLLIPLAPILTRYSSLVNKTPIGHVPAYYVVWGLTMSITTAIAEEVLVNGYLITRLDQLGWSPNRALVLSLMLRTSYHVYYGIGFLLTIPFGYFVTRSFQKNRQLNRPIAAHFLFDAVLFTIAILG